MPVATARTPLEVWDRLSGSGLTAAEVAGVIATGHGAMPAGIVTGQDAADVAAHVASIAE